MEFEDKSFGGFTAGYVLFFVLRVEVSWNRSSELVV